MAEERTEGQVDEDHDDPDQETLEDAMGLEEDAVGHGAERDGEAPEALEVLEEAVNDFWWPKDGRIPRRRMQDLTPLSFYRDFVALSRPCLIEGAMGDWEALHRQASLSLHVHMHMHVHTSLRMCFHQHPVPIRDTGGKPTSICCRHVASRSAL